VNIHWFALKNLRRNKFWTGITVGISAVAIASIFTSFIIVAGIGYSLEVGVERLGADLIVYPSGKGQDLMEAIQAGSPALFYMSNRTVDKVREIKGVAKASPELFLKTLTMACCSLAVPYQLIGFDPESDFFIMPWLKRHRLEGLAEDEIIIGADVPFPRGEDLKIFGRSFKVKGVLERTGMGTDKTIYIPLETARIIAHKREFRADEISSILVKVDAGYDIHEVAARIRKAVPGAGVMTLSQLLRSVKVIFDRMKIMISLVFLVIVALSSASIMGIFYAMGKERGAEIGILRSLGAKKKDILSLILLESIVSTFSGGVFGVLLSAFLVYNFNALLSRSLPFPFVLTSGGVFRIGVLCLLISGLLGLLSAFYPAWESSRRDPFDAIRYGA